MKKIIQTLWWCKICRWHKWTSEVDKIGIVSNDQSPKDANALLERFIQLSTLYCDRCGCVSELSVNFNKNLRERCKSLGLK